MFGFTNIGCGRFRTQGRTDRGRLRPRQPTFRHERIAEYKATRTRMHDMRTSSQGPRGRQGARDPGLRAGGLRGRRRDRDPGRPGGGRGPRDRDPDRRPGHAPAGQRAHQADGLAARRDRQHRHLRPRPDRRALGAAAGPELDTGPQGDPRHIPGIRGWGRDRVEADCDLGSLVVLYELSTGDPEKLRPLLAEFRETVLESRELMGLVRDSRSRSTRLAAGGGVRPRGLVRLFREYEFRT